MQSKSGLNESEAEQYMMDMREDSKVDTMEEV